MKSLSFLFSESCNGGGSGGLRSNKSKSGNVKAVNRHLDTEASSSNLINEREMSETSSDESRNK